ncbi:hypothetical protein DPMN_013784 [Dreissena polymorpha]|uniref:Uncharacterized protein n=2 Tax=Dreissena polymorpha TaxID=45954 RepID=A0A9D4NAG0_DREPO|nr:hypothetical protein DPMN_013784 [Dreissena polymorpha]
MKTTVFFLAIVWLLPRRVQGQTQDQVDALYKTLVNGHKKNTRPAVNHSFPTEVNVSFSLFQLVDVDEAMGKLSISGQLIMEWYDHRMSWNPIDYGGVNTITVPSSATWKPDLVLTEPIDNAIAFGHAFGHMQSWVTVRYLYDGKAIFAPAGVISSVCNISVYLYPFDEHECVINLFPWGMNKQEIVLNTNTTQLLNISIFSEDPEWILDRNETSTGVMFDNIFCYRVVLYLIRRSAFVTTNIIVPMYFLVILNAMVFVIPASSEERVTCAMTVLLAMAFFMTVVHDTLPKVSDPTPRICTVIMCYLLLSALIAIMTIINLRISKLSEGDGEKVLNNNWKIWKNWKNWNNWKKASVVIDIICGVGCFAWVSGSGIAMYVYVSRNR